MDVLSRNVSRACNICWKAVSRAGGSAFCAPSRRHGGGSGSAAVEFALIAPVFMLLVFGLFAASVLTATVNGLEQMTAGAARSTIGGLSDTERGSLASSYIAANVSAYPYIDPRALVLSTNGNATARTFTVAISYDLSTNQLLTLLRTLVPITPNVITRKAVIVNGGS